MTPHEILGWVGWSWFYTGHPKGGPGPTWFFKGPPLIFQRGGRRPHLCLMTKKCLQFLHVFFTVLYSLAPSWFQKGPPWKKQGGPLAPPCVKKRVEAWSPESMSVQNCKIFNLLIVCH